MKQIEVERKTVDEAIASGLLKLGLSLEDVRIEVLEEGAKGLFGIIGVKQARVRLTVREEEAQEEAPREAPPPRPAAPTPRSAPVPPVSAQPTRQQAPPRGAAPAPRPRNAPVPATRAQAGEGRRPRHRDDETTAPLQPGEADRARAFLLDVTGKMGVEVTAEPSEKEGTLVIDIQGDEKGILIGHRGETLDALQYLVGLVHNKDREQYRRVQLDSQNYRQKREETLVRLAHRLADKAVRSNHRVALEPMNPYERRILHSALQGNRSVTTHSEGEEPNRRVVIVPAARGGTLRREGDTSPSRTLPDEGKFPTGTA